MIIHYIVEDFINSMIEEGNFCTNIMKKNFTKELVMTKKDNEYFENSTKRWICDNFYVECGVQVRDHCHITGKYRGSVHED